MTVAAPLLTRRAVLQAAVEASYRQEATLTLDDCLFVEEPQYSIDPTLLERNFARNDISPLAIIIGRKQASMTFTTELRGNGKQQSGLAIEAPLIARLFRACGFSQTSITTPEAGPVLSVGEVAINPVFTTGGTIATTDLIVYHLEVVTGGASGVATIRSTTSDMPLEDTAAQVVTSGTPFEIGTKGLEVTATWSGNLRAGDKWVVTLFPVGIRLDPISDNFESLTLKLNMDGVAHKMLGCFGNFSINAQAGQYATIEWTFQGTFEDSVDEILPEGNYETALPQMVELARLRVDNFYAIVDTFTFDIGNDIQIRPDVSSKEGYVGTRIVARTPEGGIDPEAELVANHDFWGKLGNADRMPFQMRIGHVPGNTIWVLAPCTQYSGLTYQDRNGIRTYDAGLRFARVNGNDEIAFFLM